jgi:hypothetical protein
MRFIVIVYLHVTFNPFAGKLMLKHNLFKEDL